MLQVPIDGRDQPSTKPGNNTATCTFGFMFRGSDGKRYMSTAGHCVLFRGSTNIEGEKVWPSGTGPLAQTKFYRPIGRFVYAVLDDSMDFAIIELFPGVKARPQMCHFGGPTALNTSDVVAPGLLHHYGNGIGVGQILPARSAAAATTGDRNEAFAWGAAVLADSGSPVIDSEGAAVGLLVEIGPHGGQGLIGITRFRRELYRAADALGIHLTLERAPLL